MTTQHTFGPLAVSEKPGNAMGQPRRPFAVLRNHETSHTVFGVGCVEPKPAIVSAFNLRPKALTNCGWINCGVMASGVLTSTTTELRPILNRQFVGVGAELLTAMQTGREDRLRIVKPVMFLDVAVRAQEFETVGMGGDFSQGDATGFVLPLNGVVEVQRTKTALVTALLARAAKRIHKVASDSMRVVAIHDCLIRYIVGLRTDRIIPLTV